MGSKLPEETAKNSFKIRNGWDEYFMLLFLLLKMSFTPKNDFP